MTKLEKTQYENTEIYNELQNLRNTVAVYEKQVKQLQRIQKQSLNNINSMNMNTNSQLNNLNNSMYNINMNNQGQNQMYNQGNHINMNRNYQQNSSYNYDNNKPLSQSFVQNNEPILNQQYPSEIKNKIFNTNNEDLVNHSVNYNSNYRNVFTGVGGNYEIDMKEKLTNERNIETMRNLKSVLNKIDNKISSQQQQSKEY